MNCVYIYPAEACTLLFMQLMNTIIAQWTKRTLSANIITSMLALH